MRTITYTTESLFTWKPYPYNLKFQKLVLIKSSGRTVAGNSHKEHAIRNEPQDAPLVTQSTGEEPNNLKVDQAIYLPQEVVFISCIRSTFIIWFLFVSWIIGSNNMIYCSDQIRSLFMSYCSGNNQELTRMMEMQSKILIRTLHQVNLRTTQVSIYLEHSV